MFWPQICDPDLGGTCGRIRPIGNGYMIPYQQFEYAAGHWFQKSTENVLGTVLCCPGCFSMWRLQTLKKVLETFSSITENGAEFLRQEQGEDRWLCTLAIGAGWKLGYNAAAVAHTFAPFNFSAFFEQRRRWLPSTVFNTWDVMRAGPRVEQRHQSAVLPLSYRAYILVTLTLSMLIPSTIILLVAGGFSPVLHLGMGPALLLSLFPPLAYIGWVLFRSNRHQCGHPENCRNGNEKARRRAQLGHVDAQPFLVDAESSKDFRRRTPSRGEQEMPEGLNNTDSPGTAPTLNSSNAAHWANGSTVAEQMFDGRNHVNNDTAGNAENPVNQEFSGGTSVTNVGREQLFMAKIMSVLYIVLFVVVMVGFAISVDGLYIGDIFFIVLAGVFVASMIVHPRDLQLVFSGIIFLFLIPMGYLVVPLYAFTNMNVKSWGTRMSVRVPLKGTTQYPFADPRKVCNVEGDTENHSEHLSTIEDQLHMYPDRVFLIQAKNIAEVDVYCTNKLKTRGLQDEREMPESSFCVAVEGSKFRYLPRDQLSSVVSAPDEIHVPQFYLEEIIKALPKARLLLHRHWRKRLRRNILKSRSDNSTSSVQDGVQEDLNSLRNAMVTGITLVNLIFPLTVAIASLSTKMRLFHANIVGFIFLGFCTAVIVFQFVCMMVHRFRTLVLLISTPFTWEQSCYRLAKKFD
eukprot:gb/GECG01012558.1/.p1 GENE.gb/GECG01012558.1/~~gb/GECG01012558.1/.p1  ORF type:complete len:685 (+),score=48.43 gb/GECG01012558.1/:1-2055(+)